MSDDERQHLLQKKENGSSSELSGKEEEDDSQGDGEDVEGSFGWVVVLACFLINFVIDGVTYSFGMLMKPLMEEMDEGNFGGATIGSIQVNTSIQ